MLHRGIIAVCSEIHTKHTNTYLLTPRCRVFLEKLTGLQLVKKFPVFHGTRRFITALTSVRHLSLSWASPIQSTSHLLEIHPNIIHPSKPRSPQWSLSLRFPYEDPIHPPSPHSYAPHAQPISFFSILSPAQYWVRRSTQGVHTNTLWEKSSFLINSNLKVI